MEIVVPKKKSTEVNVHPLVLLSVVDHYHRVAKDTQRRVVGVLLGQRSKDKVDISNSFAVPFEEDLKNPAVWFLDHNFLETMYWMFKKVTSKSTFRFYKH
jgi:26S proteasome regulatory subunit N8